MKNNQFKLLSAVAAIAILPTLLLTSCENPQNKTDDTKATGTKAVEVEVDVTGTKDTSSKQDPTETDSGEKQTEKTTETGSGKIQNGGADTSTGFGPIKPI